MLNHLRIRDFAIIDDTEIEPGQGLSALTGETGAGKSILLDALGLVLGERARSDKVREGADRAEVTASFDIDDGTAAHHWLSQHDLDIPDGDCVLRRVVTAAGKSRASINGSSVPVASLKTLGNLLVSIHGQSAHHALASGAEQRRLLDAISPHASLARTNVAWDQWQAAQQQVESFEAAQGGRQQQHDLLSFQLQEFDQADLGDLTVEALEQEHRWLADVDRSRQAGTRIEQALEHAAAPALADALPPLAELVAVDGSLQEALDLVESAAIQVSEATRMVGAKVSALESDDARLSWLDERLGVLHGLAKKHGIPVKQLADTEDRLRQELDTLTDPAGSLEALTEARDTAYQAWLKQALILSRHRQKAARQLGEVITESMQGLAMEGGVFRVVVDRDESRIERHGVNRVIFEVSPNPGVAPAPLSQVASGGELSRIGLALQLASLDQHEVPTLIFDEVDTGIGGAVGETVGRLLRRLGDSYQVMCVTHLPQVAAQAHDHLKVSKTVSDGRTHTQLDRLDKTQKRDEIARMLGGKKITAKTRQHAAEMLENVSS